MLLVGDLARSSAFEEKELRRVGDEGVIPRCEGDPAPFPPDKTETSYELD